MVYKMPSRQVNIIHSHGDLCVSPGEYLIQTSFTGLEQSTDSHGIYSKYERKHMNVMDTMKKLSIGFMIFAYGPHLFIPISYLCFGVPSREEWILPLQAKYNCLMP